ncbi:dual specificity protein phosphatase 13 isoform X2 [Octodon degus]|uniref:Dual specificity protein phosphatase 13 isoform X2 n=1 Tax=Octodon degus TaxID=10160 RepID=A0A6P6EQL0_OCTDE|nr:dual specificity protein phosphatase 13 isoform X2 [Octodon degus]
MAEASLPELGADVEGTTCPSVLELEELLRAGKASCSRVDEVWPNLFIGDAATANNRFELWKLGITHVLNAAHGGLYCQGGPDFYGSSVSYLGVPAHDLPDFDISTYFSSAADFIHQGLSSPGAVPAPGCADSAGATMDLPQPWLPPPAPPAGPAAAGWRVSELKGQSRDLVLLTGLCHFTTVAKPLLLLQLLLLLLEALVQKQHQVFRDRQSPARGTNCASEKPLARARHLHRMDSLQKQDLRRPKIHGAGRPSPYQPPTLASLQRLLWVRRAPTLSHVNEVWPNLFLGDAYAARDKSRLLQMGITHVVNAAAGRFQVDTGAKFYHGLPLEYYGIEAEDNPYFDISIYFLPVARYIRAALSAPRGRVLVHCAMGVSRSATLVLAFLMICENMTLVEAIQAVQAHRDICPNSGFLRQLQVLDNRLGREAGRL